MMKAKPMQKVKTFLEKTPNALLCLLGAVVFLAGFYLLTSRTPLNKIWLPTTMNNDEVLYNRQVVSVITHGGPQGYFGYQEGTADIGRYGTWGPLLIWAYALPGFLFGSSVNVVLWCNLLFITLGIAAFARSAKLNWWQCIVLCAGLFAIAMPIRSCISGASEAMICWRFSSWAVLRRCTAPIRPAGSPSAQRPVRWKRSSAPTRCCSGGSR